MIGPAGPATNIMRSLSCFDDLVIECPSSLSYQALLLLSYASKGFSFYVASKKRLIL